MKTVSQEEVFDRTDRKIVSSRQERDYRHQAALRNCSMIPGVLTIILKITT